MNGPLRERVGRIGVWMLVPTRVPMPTLLDTARAIESLGYGALWCAETSATREALVQASLILGATDRLVVATGITSIYSRDAIALHAGASALEEVYPGRFVLGIGVSHAPAVESRGHDYGRPLSSMEAYLDALDQIGDAQPYPRVLAALRSRMMELARDRALGAHTYFVPPGHTAQARATLGPEPLLAPELTTVFDTDAAEARARARRFMARYLALPNYRRNLLELGYLDEELVPDAPSDRVVDELVAWGSVDAIVDRIDAHWQAGADHVCVQVLSRDPAEVVERLRVLAEALR